MANVAPGEMSLIHLFSESSITCVPDGAADGVDSTARHRPSQATKHEWSGVIPHRGLLRHYLSASLQVP